MPRCRVAEKVLASSKRAVTDDAVTTSLLAAWEAEGVYKSWGRNLCTCINTFLQSNIQASSTNSKSQSSSSKPPSKMTDNTNPGNFANRPKEEVSIPIKSIRFDLTLHRSRTSPRRVVRLPTAAASLLWTPTYAPLAPHCSLHCQCHR